MSTTRTDKQKSDNFKNSRLTILDKNCQWKRTLFESEIC